MDPILSIGAAGVLNASSRFAASAQRMVSGDSDIATEAVEQVADKAAFRASLAVIKTGDEMLKQLLDIKA